LVKDVKSEWCIIDVPPPKVIDQSLNLLALLSNFSTLAEPEVNVFALHYFPCYLELE
jgi:hypothetical protein